MNTADSSTLRHVELGHCQLCELEFKLHGSRLVMHGYTRPGDGQQHGRCPGVGHLPYELSCDQVKAQLVWATASLPGARATLAQLESGAVLHLSVLMRTTRGVELVQLAACVCTQAAWTRALNIATDEAEHTVRALEHTIERATKRIAAWKLTEVTKTTEQAIDAAERAAKAAVATEKAAARQAKKDAAAARQGKVAARAQALRTLLDGFAAQFTALAEQAEGAERSALVDALVAEVSKKKHQKVGGAWGIYELGCDEALVTLGLAVDPYVRTGLRTQYRYTFSV